MPISHEQAAAPLPSFPDERSLVHYVYDTNPEGPFYRALQEHFDLQVNIVSILSRENPDGSGRQMISPSRVASIPFTTARWMGLVKDAGRSPGPEEILYEWRVNTPANTGDRHPDSLFDIAQYNFGSDQPVNQLSSTFTTIAQARLAMARRYRSVVHQVLAGMRYDPGVEEEMVDALIASMYE